MVKALRFWFLFLVVLVVLLGAGLGAAYLNRLALSEWAIGQIAHARGYEIEAIDVTKLTLRNAEIKNVALRNPALHIEHIDLTYDYRTLLSGRVEVLEVSGLRVELNTGQTPTSAEPGPSALDFSPLLGLGGRVSVKDAEIAAEIAMVGPVVAAVTLDGDFTKPEGDIKLTARAAPRAAPSSLKIFELEADGVIVAEGLDLQGDLNLLLDGLPTTATSRAHIRYKDFFRLRTEGSDVLFIGNETFLSLFTQSGETGDLASLATIKSNVTDVKTSLTDLLTYEVHINDAVVVGADWPVSLDKVKARAMVSADGLIEPASITGRIAPPDEQPISEPMFFAMTATPENETISMAGTAGPDKARELAIVDGRYDLLTGKGTLTITADDIAFEKSGLQPSDLSPYMVSVDAVEGPARAKATVNWGPDEEMSTSGQLELLKLDLSYGGVRFKELSGILNFDDLIDLKTLKYQTVEAKEISSPVALAAPKIEFKINHGAPSPEIDIKIATAGLAGGELHIDPVVYEPLSPREELVLKVKSLDLAELLDQWTAGRLSGTGTISGAIPLTILDTSDLTITGGRIDADGEGVLQLDWGEARDSLTAQGTEVSMLVGVLEDFHYKALGIDIDRRQGEQITLRVRLEGNNPAVLDGQPFRLNIGLSGNLETMFAALAAGQGLTMDMIGGQLGAN